MEKKNMFPLYDEVLQSKFLAPKVAELRERFPENEEGDRQDEYYKEVDNLVGEAVSDLHDYLLMSRKKDS